MAKIEYIQKPNTDKEIFDSLNSVMGGWFKQKFGKFSDAQKYSMINIRDRKNLLLSSPTGSGKTLSAFGSILNYLIDLDDKNELEDKVYCIYISPLKSLVNDIQVNLNIPLMELEQIAGKKLGIRVGLRTGDTTPKERAMMFKKTPHIIVTTPESLALLLTSPKFVERLNAVEFVIVDEIHALTNKRGTYLSLTLERLCDISLIEPVRIGLSATISPLEEIAKFLVGAERDCLIAEVNLEKKIDINLDFPGKSILEAESVENQKELYKILDELIWKHKTTLIFTNTRAATERIVHYLDLYFPGKYTGLIGVHHSSISKERRFGIEEGLRKGELKVVVSSTSLELGIDIGYIDLVILLKSPKSVSRSLQRVGRAGHKLHENPKGRFIVLDRDDLVECGILMKNMTEKKIDSIDIPKNALDVLAQQIFGMAISRPWKSKDMLKVIRRSYCYENLSKDDFFSVISYLAGDYALEHRHVYAKIWYEEEKGEIGKRGKLARVIYMTNIGTIPEEGFIDVVIQSPAEKRGISVGKIDESFLEKMKRGDIFVLGGQKYQFLFSRGMKAYVKGDVSRNPTIPSWASEMLPLNFELALDIGKFRRLVKERLGNKKQCVEFIQEYIYCKEDVAKEIYDYFNEQNDFSVVPDDRLIVVEKFKDFSYEKSLTHPTQESWRFKEEKEYLLFHSLFGRRVNDALARAYAYAAARLKHRDVEIGVNDNGFFISGEKLEEDKIIGLVKSKDLEIILREAIEKTEILKRRFRHCAARSLMILRNYKGREKSVGKQQVHSGFLFAAVKKISDEFPILREARREVMEDLMDIKNAKKVVEWLEEGKVKIKKLRVPVVSPFGLNLLMQGRSDLIKIEDRAAFLKRMHELHLKIIGEKGK